MGRSLKFLTVLALLLSGCGVGTLRRLGLKAKVDDGEKNRELLALSSAFLVGCGPTVLAPAELQGENLETFGCTVISKSEKRKVESNLVIYEVDVFLPDGTIARRPALVNPVEESPWHVFFNLGTAKFAGVTRIQVQAHYGDDLAILKNGGLIVYDPEDLTDRDEKENAFKVPKPGDSITSFKKVDGHILFVTQDEVIPGKDFNSAAGASLRCSIDAQKIVKLAIYRFSALVSDDEHDARDVLKLNGPIRNVAEEIMVEDGSTLFSTPGFDGKLQVSNGDAASNALRVWTGSTSEGLRSAGKTCGSWGSSDTAAMGVVGNPSNEAWQAESEGSCDKAYRLYCISK